MNCRCCAMHDVYDAEDDVQICHVYLTGVIDATELLGLPAVEATLCENHRAVMAKARTELKAQLDERNKTELS